jgi:tRNA-Thr(GGU) m(6)t(6)A37 methyltransferase TsaA
MSWRSLVTASRYELVPVGWVASALVELADAPPQADEGAPEARIVLRPDLEPALLGLQPGDDVVVVTWLDRGDRRVLQVHPRGDEQRPVQGVFATRSPDRPNPIGLHEVRIVAIEATTITVSGLEAIDATPVVDLKPVLGPTAER